MGVLPACSSCFFVTAAIEEYWHLQFEILEPGQGWSGPESQGQILSDSKSGSESASEIEIQSRSESQSESQS